MLKLTEESHWERSQNGNISSNTSSHDEPNIWKKSRMINSSTQEREMQRLALEKKDFLWNHHSGNQRKLCT